MNIVFIPSILHPAIAYTDLPARTCRLSNANDLYRYTLTGTAPGDGEVVTPAGLPVLVKSRLEVSVQAMSHMREMIRKYSQALRDSIRSPTREILDSIFERRIYTIHAIPCIL